MKSSGEISTPSFKTHETGAQRQTDADVVRLDRCCPTALLAWATICAEGYEHYERNGIDYNWCLGLPVDETLNHLERHLQLAKLGGDEEGDTILHLSKVIWNAAALIHYLSGCNHHRVMMQLQKEAEATRRDVNDGWNPTKEKP